MTRVISIGTHGADAIAILKKNFLRFQVSFVWRLDNGVDRVMYVFFPSRDFVGGTLISLRGGIAASTESRTISWHYLA